MGASDGVVHCYCEIVRLEGAGAEAKAVTVAGRTLIVRKGQPLEIESLSELGIFGTFLRQGDKVLVNKEAGHLVRTKVRGPAARAA